MKLFLLLAIVGLSSIGCIVEPAINGEEGNGISVDDSRIQLSNTVPNAACGNDQILVWNDGQWHCSDGTVPMCSDGQELSWSDNHWVCSDAVLPTCSNDQSPVWNNNQWECGSSLPNCNNGETLYRNNGQWECSGNGLASLNCAAGSFPAWNGNNQYWECSGDSGGAQVGMNTSPTVTLDIAGHMKVSETITCNALTETSSRRYKTNIRPIQEPLTKLQKLQGVTYLKKATGQQDIGLIAEDVAQIFPELVSTTADGKVDALNYGRLTSVLVEAVKSQQKQIAKLSKQNALQTKQIEKLLQAQ